jgi:hypothetical protein
MRCREKGASAGVVRQLAVNWAGHFKCKFLGPLPHCRHFLGSSQLVFVILISPRDLSTFSRRDFSTVRVQPVIIEFLAKTLMNISPGQVRGREFEYIRDYPTRCSFVYRFGGSQNLT